ncbi:MAG: rRNA maturation RNase YbeY [Elusimicrobiota bacterium]
MTRRASLRVRFSTELDTSSYRLESRAGVSRAGSWRSLEAAARRGALRALRRGKARGPGVLNVVWTSRGRLLALNRRFRRTDAYTDVIAFRYEDPPPGPGRRPAAPPFGDLYIAVPQARANARRFGAGLREELIRLVVHGTLHLLGYTDYTPRAKKVMWTEQEKIVRALV